MTRYSRRQERLPIAAADIEAATRWALASVENTTDPEGWELLIDPSTDSADIIGATAQGLRAFIVRRRYIGTGGTR
jgi:hypothetical protein